jgi:hypothetical protein
MDFQKKYLKYKKKYLQLKTLQQGGSSEYLDSFLEITTEIDVLTKEACIELLIMFCPDDSISLEYKKNIKKLRMGNKDLENLGEKINTNFTEYMNEEEKINNTEKIKTARTKLDEILKCYKKLQVDVPGASNITIPEEKAKKVSSPRITEEAVIPSASNIARPVEKAKTVSSSIDRGRDIDNIVAELKVKFPHLNPERFFNTDKILFDVIGDGRCGFYSAILSAIIVIGRKLYKRVSLHEKTMLFFTSVLSIEKFDSQSVIEFLSKLKIPDPEDGEFGRKDKIEYLRDKNDILSGSDSLNTYSNAIVKKTMELNCPDLNIIFLTEESKKGEEMDNKLNVFIYHSGAHFKFILSKGNAEYLIHACNISENICRIFREHDFEKSNRPIESQAKSRLRELEEMKSRIPAETKQELFDVINTCKEIECPLSRDEIDDFINIYNKSHRGQISKEEATSIKNKAPVVPIYLSSTIPEKTASAMPEKMASTIPEKTASAMPEKMASAVKEKDKLTISEIKSYMEKNANLSMRSLLEIWGFVFKKGIAIEDIIDSFKTIYEIIRSQQGKKIDKCFIIIRLLSSFSSIVLNNRQAGVKSWVIYRNFALDNVDPEDPDIDKIYILNKMKNMCL